MISNRWVARWSVRVGLPASVVLLALAVTALPTQASSSLRRVSATPERAGAPRVKALVIGAEQSPVLTALGQKEGFSATRLGSPGTPTNPRDYNLLVVDGANLPPNSVGSSLRSFGNAGRPVLALNVSDSLAREIAAETGFRASTGGSQQSAAFLFVRGTAGGSNIVRMVDMRRLAPYDSWRVPKQEMALAEQAAGRTMADSAYALATTAGSDTVKNAPSSLPPEAQHIEWSYTEKGQAYQKPGWWNYGNKMNDGFFIFYPNPATDSQLSTWTITHTFDDYLDNGAQHPLGNNQIITYNVNGEFSPSNGKFFHMYEVGRAGTYDKAHFERAWWTGLAKVEVKPEGDTDSKLIWQANQPQTTNEETEYKSGDEFEVGVSASKEGAEFETSYKISNEQAHKIPDWGVSSDTSGNRLAWEFSSRSPCDARPDHFNEEGCFDIGAGHDALPKLPNELSLGQLPIAATGRWKTTKLLSSDDGTMSFEVETPITLVDTYCDKWAFGTFACNIGGREIARTQTGPEKTTYSFDAAVVNPVPIKSVDLTPNPANGAKSETVKGTVTLERPAPLDVTVIIYSDSPNAVVGGPSGRGSMRPIKIAKGSTSGSFDVLTNDNKLKPGEHTTASITAFYATPTTKQLRIESP